MRMKEISSTEPLVVCMYGWGRTLRLYLKHLDLDGTCYALSDLLQVSCIYQQFMGIASARLELAFGQQKVSVRGIAAVNDARRIAAYLTQWLDQPQPMDDRVEGREVGAGGENARHGQVAALPIATSPEIPDGQRAHQEQRALRLRRLQAERSLREHGFDVEKLARDLRTASLPPIKVPISLFPGECAYYRTEARRCCKELQPFWQEGRNKVRSDGALIFTNKRVLYLSRRGQMRLLLHAQSAMTQDPGSLEAMKRPGDFALSYAHLLSVSCLRRTVVLVADHRTEREIFEVPRPLECTMYLEHLLHRFR